MKKKVVLLILALFMFIPTTMLMVACGETPPGAPGDGGNGGGDQVTNEPCVECVWGEWSVEFPATCGEKGSDIRYCTVCRSPDYRQTPETGEHDYIEGYRHEASCYYAGYQEYYCNVCGDNYHDEIPQRQHNMVLETEILSCDSYGLRRYECSHDDCGYIEEDYEVAPAGHDWGNGTYHEATCLNDAYTYYECQRTGCYQSNTEYDMEHLALGHNKGEEMLDWYQAPTCVDYGYHYFDCTRCEDYIDEQIDRLPHHFVEVETVPATCQEYAYTEYACDGENCYETKTEYDEDGGYADHNYIVLEEYGASCASDGWKELGCINDGCSSFDTVVLPKLGHDFSVLWETITEANCESGGKESYVCSRYCGEFEEHDIDPLGHDLDATTHVCKRELCYEHEYLDIITEIKDEGFTIHLFINGVKEDKKDEVGTSLTIPILFKEDGLVYEVASENMDQITDLVLPNGLNAIDLTGASALERLTIPSVANEMLSEYFGNENADDYDNSQYVPSTLIEVTILTGNITDYAFADLNKLEIVNLADNTLRIGNYAFKNCTSLKTFNFKNVTNALEGIFENTGFETLTIPTGINVGKCILKNSTQLHTINVETTSFNGDNAFEGCTNLTSVTLTEGMTQGNSMFKDCTKLTTINLPNSATYLNNCYEGCTNLSTANVPENALQIDYMFKGCTNLKVLNYGKKQSIGYSHVSVMTDSNALTTLNIEDTVQQLGLGVFDGVNGLKTLSIPNGVDYNRRLFDSLTTLEEVTTDGKLEVMFSDPATQLANLKKMTVTGDILSTSLLQYNTGINLVLTGPIVTGTNYFMNSTIESVEYKFNSINQGSFAGSTTIRTIIFNEGMTSLNIKLQGCPNLTSIQLPSTLDNISANCFSGSNLSTLSLPDSLKTIGVEAFMNMTNLTSVNIPSSLTSIGARAFKGCSNLVIDVFTIPTGLSVYEFRDEEFVGIKGINTFKVTVETAFSADTAFKNVPITTLETIGYFPQDANVANVQINFSDITSPLPYDGAKFTFNQAITSMCDSAFKGHGGVENLTLSDTITEIPTSAFEECSINRLDLSANVTKIKGSAFKNAQSLSYINLDNVTLIYQSAFEGCERLMVIASHGINSDALTKVTKIYLNAFKGCTTLSAKINLVSAIDVYDNAFDGTAITSLVIPATVTVANSAIQRPISANSFANCTALKEVIIECDLEAIDADAFTGTNNIETLVAPNREKYHELGTLIHKINLTIDNVKYITVTSGWGNVSGPNLIEVTISKDCTHVGYVGGANVEEITFLAPMISNNAFVDCENLKKLTIGSTVTQMGYSILPSGLENQIVVNYLGNIDNWYTIDFSYPSNTSSCYSIFMGTNDFQIQGTTLEELTISNTVTNRVINPYAFAGAKFTAINLGAAITEIGAYAFAYCDQITDVNIPSNIRIIDEYAFAYCDNLADMSFESYFIEIGPSIVYMSKIAEDVSEDYHQGNYIVIDGILLMEKVIQYTLDLTTFTVPVYTIADGLFYNETLIILTTDVVKISDNTFATDVTTTINYMGTQEQWEAIEGVDTLPDTVIVYYNYVPSAE